MTKVIKKALEMYKILVEGLEGFYSWCFDKEKKYYYLIEDHRNLAKEALELYKEEKRDD